MHLLHAELPDEPEEGAQGPFSLGSRLAESALEGRVVIWHVVKRLEGEQWEPDWGGPQPRLHQQGFAGVEGLEVCIEDKET